MRRRQPDIDLTEPPPVPDIGPRPRCTASTSTATVRPCGNCSAVTAHNAAVAAYHHDLDVWRDQLDHTGNPLAVVQAVNDRRRAAPRRALCLASI